MEILSRPGIVIVLVLWILPHILFLRLVTVGFCKNTLVICIVCLATVYAIKPVTFDLPKYSSYLASGYLGNNQYSHSKEDGLVLNPWDTTGDPFVQAYPSDRAFAQLARGLHHLLPIGPYLPRVAAGHYRYVSDFQVIAIAILGLFILMLACLVACRAMRAKESIARTILYCLPIVMGSVFFMIGSQNAVRQFLGMSVILLALSLFVKRQYLVALILIVLATSLHHWSIVFGIFCLVATIGIRFVTTTSKHSSSISAFLKYMTLGLTIGACAVVGIKLIISGSLNYIEMFQYFSANTSYFGELKQYGLMNMSELLSRSGVGKKLILVGILFLVSELILGHTRSTNDFDIRSFRVVTYSFLIPLSIYPELMSRVLLFYFGVEILFICWAVMREERRARLAGWIVLMGHGFALNSINVLIGSEWLYSLA
jgi:hypothetical protein